MSRGIGRMAGKGGKTKFTIENATRTRIVLANTHIRILGSYQNIKIARDAICALIMGSPPGKVYTRLRSVHHRAPGREVLSVRLERSEGAHASASQQAQRMR
jgi:RNA-binding protein PNO1